MKNVTAVSEEKNTAKKMGAVFKGAVIAIIISVLLFLILALVMLYTPLPQEIVGPTAAAISLLCVFLGAYLCAKALGEKGWLWGSVCGLIYYIILYISALSAVKEFNFSIKTLIMIIIGMLTGMLGGIWAVNSGAKKRRR